MAVGVSRTTASVPKSVAGLIEQLLGGDLPVAIEAYDGSRLGPDDPPATVQLRSPAALCRLLTAPGELGLARAYVAGDIEFHGDIFALLDLRNHIDGLRVTWREVVALLRILGPTGIRVLPPPPEEARPKGRLHSRRRDAGAISHHYDVGNAFYELVLGESMTYSCAVWTDDTPVGPEGLAQAQAAKYELICRKLDLRPGMRLLDVGCGWGGMVRHAARHHGVTAVGITLSREQANWAIEANQAQGLADQVEIRIQDYRDVRDGPFDAISSIGMFEHVGRVQLREYMQRLYSLLVPEGRLLNHAISRPPGEGERIDPNGFMGRYVFPDGELIEVGSVVTELQRAGFEARHLESLREHYALTLRAWVANLEANWDAAVRAVGPARARIWRLYLAGCAVFFEEGLINVDQVLVVKPNGGRSGVPLRMRFERRPLDLPGSLLEEVIVIR